VFPIDERIALVCLQAAGAYIALRDSGAKPVALIRTDAANLIRYRMRRKTRS
jgi:hypothetical protein